MTGRPTTPRRPPASAPGLPAGPITHAMLPEAATTRWVPRRKAVVVAAVHAGLLSAEAACQRYNLTLEEFAGWQRAFAPAGGTGRDTTGRRTRRTRTPLAAGAGAEPKMPPPVDRARFDPAALAKLESGAQQQFCVIDRATLTGLDVTLFGPMARDGVVEVVLANGERLRAQWLRSAGARASLRFLEPVAIERLTRVDGDIERRRQLRARLALHGMLHLGETASEIGFYDMSRHGAAFKSERWLLIGELVRLETSLLPTITAKVRWRNHPHYGVSFDQAIDLDALDGSAERALNHA